MLDLVALQALGVVRAQGSVAAAATILGFTPSAVSQQLKKLERQTGAPVLERYGRGVLLTDHGRRLATLGAELLDRVEQIEAEMGAANPSISGSIRLAAFSTAVRGLVAPALSRMAHDGYDVDLTLVEMDPPEAMDAVASGQVDLALVHQWGDTAQLHPDHVDVEEVGRDVADLLVPANHRLARRSSVTPADVRHEVFCSAPVGSVCHDWLTRMFRDVGGLPPIAYWAMEWSSHVALVAQGAAVTLLPRLGRDVLPDSVCLLPVRDPLPTRVVSLAWRRSMGSNPTVQYVREVVRELGVLG